MQIRLGLGFFLLSFLGWVQAAPNLTLANIYQRGIPLNQYLVSEKYDGVRGYWDGSALWSRSGQRITAPVAFTQQLPVVALDGELWFGRNQFSRANALLKLDALHPKYQSEWQQVRYMVFDAPSQEGNFSQRLAYLHTLNLDDRPNVQIVEQTKITDEKQLQTMLDEMSAAGAEGLMLRRIKAPYRGGRSDDLLKLKLWHDAEAAVVARIPGSGKYQGQMGSLLVRLEDGREIRIGSGFKDEERANPPALGTRITFRFQGLTSTGLPRFPVYWRERNE